MKKICKGRNLCLSLPYNQSNNKNFSLMAYSTPQLWQFFYINEDHVKIAVGIIKAKMPQRTKKYKRNLERLHRPNVRSVGYETIK
jgi:hypothetical protein